MLKMSLHYPFGQLKHKLWPKEGSGIKLPIWLSTTKIQESPWCICVQVTCHILLKSFQRGLQLCFKTHLNWRSAHKVMDIHNCGSPNFENFGTSTWKFGTKWHLSAGPVAMHKEYCKGEGGHFPQVRAVMSLVSPCLPVVRPCTKSAPTMH
jgi:hypothetical protein